MPRLSLRTFRRAAAHLSVGPVRRAPAHLLRSTLVLGLLVGAACAVNPATGERQLLFIGQEREIEIGRENDPVIVAEMGLYPDSALQRYVRGLGEALAAESEMPDLPWTFRVLDDPAINAFALPGGFIYVTRGILAHMTSEAQLVGVLGHEIGHVTARHGASRMSRTQLFQGVLGVGSIVSEDFRGVSDVVGAGLGILNLRYGRGDESQADDLGIRYMTRIGYDPAELAGVMAMLGRSSELASPGGRAPEWLSTHPDPENRVAAIQEEVSRRGDPGGLVRADSFVERLEGMPFGRNPREGFVGDGVFHHPDLAFRFDVPEGWRVDNRRASVVVGVERAQFVLTIEDEPIEAAAADFEAIEGVRPLGRDRTPVNGNPAVSVDFSVSVEGERLTGRATFVDYGGRSWRLLAIADGSATATERRTADGIIRSFREESDPAILAVEPDRIEVVRLDRETPLDEFLARYPAPVEPEVIALINQIDGPEGELGPGPVKRIVGEER